MSETKERSAVYWRRPLPTLASCTAEAKDRHQCQHFMPVYSDGSGGCMWHVRGGQCAHPGANLDVLMEWTPRLDLWRKVIHNKFVKKLMNLLPDYRERYEMLESVLLSEIERSRKMQSEARRQKELL